MTPEMTLKGIQETLKGKESQKKVHNFRASDFLTQQQMDEVHEANRKGKKRKFDPIDAYIAEIIARFGYDAYIAWKTGAIGEQDMVHYIEAERAREVQKTLALETIIIGAVAGSNHPTKHGNAPKSLKMAIDVLKKEQNRAKGEF